MAEAVTQRDPDLISYTGFAGVRNDVAPERIDRADLAAAENINLDGTGKISMRAGRIVRSATATHSLWSDNDQIALCVQGTALKRINADFSLTTIKTGLTAGLRMSYVKVNDRVYFSNGRETGVLDNGVVRSWGLPVPGAPGIAVGVGDMPAGDYQVVYTYVRNDDQESGAGLGTRVTVPTNGKLVFTFPVVPDSTIRERNVYITTPNGNVFYEALTVPAATLTAEYTGDTKEFNHELDTQFLSPPPAGHLVSYYNGQMYVAVGDVLFPSEPFGYELFNLQKYIPLGARVTLAAPMEDKETIDTAGTNSGFFLGTTADCGILVGTNADEFRYVPKTTYGAIEGALDYVDGTLFEGGGTGARKLPMWLTTKGVCVGLPGLEIRNVTSPRFTFQAAGAGAAVFHPEFQRYIAVSNF